MSTERAMKSTPHLTKSRYLAALQCDRRLWLEVHDSKGGTPLGEAQRHIFRMGAEVGKAAHELFPGGVLVEASPADHAEAVAETDRLMADEAVPAIFEAAFEYEGVRIRVDILERLGARRGSGKTGSRWGLREVKSSSKLKRAQHLPDLAIQKWVLEGGGIEVDSAQLVHVNKHFVRGAGAIHWRDFFQRVELLDELKDAEVEDADGIRARVGAMFETLAVTAAPEMEPGSFCKRPHPCRFWEQCTAKKPAAWFVRQTRAKPEKKARMIEVTESGQTWFSNGLSDALASASPPIWALDFEAIGAAIPFFEGTGPYRPITFQWSLHRLAADDGEPEHFDYLASGREDPREAVARSLVEVLTRDDAPILAYSNYEKLRLSDLAAHVPDLAEELNGIIDRLVDLLPIAQAHIYHRDLLGSFSLKNVGPALVPAVGYQDLTGVANGVAALAAFAEIVEGKLTGSVEVRIREELLRYCGRDTLALLEVYRAMRRGCGLAS